MTARTPVPAAFEDDCFSLAATLRAYGVTGPMIFTGDGQGGFEIQFVPECVFIESLLHPRNDNAPEAA